MSFWSWQRQLNLRKQDGGMAGQVTVITDTSVLINFLVIEKVGLLASLPGTQCEVLQVPETGDSLIVSF
jgi:hypothetical protein